MALPSETATETLSLASAGPEATQEIGRLLGLESRPGAIFLMTGELGRARPA